MASCGRKRLPVSEGFGDHSLIKRKLSGVYTRLEGHRYVVFHQIETVLRVQYQVRRRSSERMVCAIYRNGVGGVRAAIEVDCIACVWRGELNVFNNSWDESSVP